MVGVRRGEVRGEREQRRRDARVVAVFALLDLVPALDEVLDDVEDDGAAEGHVHLYERERA